MLSVRGRVELGIIELSVLKNVDATVDAPTSSSVAENYHSHSCGDGTTQEIVSGHVAKSDNPSAAMVTKFWSFAYDEFPGFNARPGENEEG